MNTETMPKPIEHIPCGNGTLPRYSHGDLKTLGKKAGKTILAFMQKRGS